MRNYQLATDVTGAGTDRGVMLHMSMAELATIRDALTIAYPKTGEDRFEDLLDALSEPVGSEAAPEAAPAWTPAVREGDWVSIANTFGRWTGQVDSDSWLGHNDIEYVMVNATPRAVKSLTIIGQPPEQAEAPAPVPSKPVSVNREYIVQLNNVQARDLINWLTDVRSGSWVIAGQRLTVDAVENGGILVRTLP